MSRRQQTRQGAARVFSFPLKSSIFVLSKVIVEPLSTEATAENNSSGFNDSRSENGSSQVHNLALNVLYVPSSSHVLVEKAQLLVGRDSHWPAILPVAKYRPFKRWLARNVEKAQRLAGRGHGRDHTLVGYSPLRKISSLETMVGAKR